MTTTPPPMPEPDVATVANQLELCSFHFAAHLLRTQHERITALEAALNDIGQYTGEGPPTTPWRDIVKACGEKARTALENTHD